MPRSEDIERFTQVLNSLGDEPAIRAARSEAIEEVAPPGVEASPADSDELDSLGLDDESTGAGSAGESESLQDIFQSLSGLAEEDAGAGAPGEDAAPGIPESFGPETAREQGPESSSGEGLDFDSLFGEQAAPEGIEDLEPGNLQADLAQMETLPDEAGLETGAAPEAAAESFDLPSLDDVSFSEPAPSLDEAEASAAEPGSSFEEPAASFDEPAPAFDEAPPSFEEPAASFDEPTQAFGETAESFGEPAPSFETPPLDEEMPSLEEPSPAASEAETEPADAGMESLGEESLGDLNLDEFSLPESAEQFGMPAAAPPVEPRAAPAPRALPAARARPAERRPRPEPAAPAMEPGIDTGEIDLTPEQFAQLKKTLASLPRNLKIIVQDLIGEGTASGPDLASLLTLLLRGASAQEIANLAGRISGKRIRIPAGYEKKTGLAFEAEQRTFAYAFRENFLPLLRVVVITVLAGGLFGFLGYNYVYRPLSAYSNYRAGYGQIANDRFTLANERFARATKVWPMKRWYYSYAEAFAAKRQYLLAEGKYDELLKEYPGDRKGTLDYARLESERLADYQKADSLLAKFLDAHHNDYDALLASGDNYLRWAERDTSKFEAARLSYATLLNAYGTRDELLFRMLRYFIRTDKGTEVERLRAFYATKPELKIDAAVFAELGGYLVDHRRLDYVQDVLFRAEKTQTGLYEVHYNLARYYRIVKNAADEKKALDATVALLDRTKNTDAVTQHRLTVEIDTHTRLGEYYYGSKEYLPSERELLTSIRLVENNQRMKLIDNDRLFGRPYAVLGDLYYTIQGDLPTAAIQYRKAIENGYTDPELTYKIGYIQYAQKDYSGALASFTSAEDASAYPSGNEAIAASAEAAESQQPRPAGQPPQNLLFALGSAFLQRGDYFAAQGSYLRLLERLETRRASLGILHPEDRPEDKALLDTLVKVNNNLGVAMFRLSQKTGDRNKKSQALVYLSTAAEIAGSLARSPDTVRRSEDRSLPSLNMRAILYPLKESVLHAYEFLPRDFKAIDW
jgi:hypothetical protein